MDSFLVSAVENCNGNYVNSDTADSLCAHSLQRYKQVSILDIFFKLKHDAMLCKILNYSAQIKLILTTYWNLFARDQISGHIEDALDAIEIWANTDAAQYTLNISQGSIGKWAMQNEDMHYSEGKNDTSCYAYDIFSSLPYHKQLASKSCRALIFIGDHDMTFPYVGVEQWAVADSGFFSSGSFC
ncbi:putative transferase [Helianthus debilis subsp. tardiflorus]